MAADHLQRDTPFPALQKHLVSVGIALLFPFNMNVSIYVILLLSLTWLKVCSLKPRGLAELSSTRILHTMPSAPPTPETFPLQQRLLRAAEWLKCPHLRQEMLNILCILGSWRVK